MINYDKENIPDVCLKAIQPYLESPEFDPEVIRRQSNAAAGLCAWVINIAKYYEVYCEVTIFMCTLFSHTCLALRTAIKLITRMHGSAIR